MQVSNEPDRTGNTLRPPTCPSATTAPEAGVRYLRHWRAPSRLERGRAWQRIGGGAKPFPGAGPSADPMWVTLLKAAASKEALLRQAPGDVARQINPICAPQLMSAERPLAAPIGGLVRVCQRT